MHLKGSKEDHRLGQTWRQLALAKHSHMHNSKMAIIRADMAAKTSLAIHSIFK